MRTLLLRLLLLAVFFNAAIGVPLHEAEHARNAAYAGVPALAPSAADDAPEPTDSQAHQVCAWCAAHAQVLGFAATAHPWQVAPAPCLGRVRAAPEVAAYDAAQWRPFAPRAPPVLLG